MVVIVAVTKLLDSLRFFVVNKEKFPLIIIKVDVIDIQHKISSRQVYMYIV